MTHDHSRCGPSFYVEAGVRYCLNDQPIAAATLRERLTAALRAHRQRRHDRHLAHIIIEKKRTNIAESMRVGGALDFERTASFPA